MERAVGAAIRRAIADGICTREELFITTKLWIQDYSNAKEAFELSLKKLGLDYVVNQVECHPFFHQKQALEAAKEFGIVLEAWGPFAEGGHGIFTHPVLTEIGNQYGKTPAQVALRFNIQRGIVVIPKSVHKDRIEQNYDVWDFALSDEDMKKIDALDLGHSEIIDHFAASTAKFLSSFKIHD